jgi:hypothetical protein
MTENINDTDAFVSDFDKKVEEIEGSQVGNPNLPNLTAYAAAKVLTRVLQTEGVISEDEEIKPQAMYAKRKTIGTDEQGRLNGPAFKEWLTKYVEQRKNGVAEGERQDYDKLAEQFM